jgi:hypothetical protein
MLKRGKKTKAWDNTRRNLKHEFIKMGILRCELRFSNCWISNGLTFAHVDKRRHLKEGELTAVVLACVHCHNIVEKWPREQMRAYLEGIIKRRRV